MNGSDMPSAPPSDVFNLAGSTLNAFVLATLGTGALYFSYRRNSSNKPLIAPASPISAAMEDVISSKDSACAISDDETDDLEFKAYKPTLFPPITPLDAALYTAAPTALPLSPPCDRHLIVPSELIQIDSRTLQRLARRRQALRCSPTAVTSFLPAAAPAIEELYTYLFSHHLPTRFPKRYGKTPSGTLTCNYATGETYPAVMPGAAWAVRAIAENLEESMQVILADGSIGMAIGAGLEKGWWGKLAGGIENAVERRGEGRRDVAWRLPVMDAVVTMSRET